MNISLKIATASFFAMAIIGCGSSDSDSKNVSTSDLKGEWIGKCDVDGASSSQEFLNFADKTLTVKYVEFANPTCNQVDSEILLDETDDYSYVLGDNITASGKNASKINLTKTGYHLSKGNTNTIPIFGEVIYQTIYLENKKIFLAKTDAEHNATSDATRPVTLDFTDPITKK
jgi:hypothetical protein